MEYSDKLCPYIIITHTSLLYNLIRCWDVNTNRVVSVGLDTPSFFIIQTYRSIVLIKSVVNFIPISMVCWSEYGYAVQYVSHTIHWFTNCDIHNNKHNNDTDNSVSQIACLHKSTSSIKYANNIYTYNSPGNEQLKNSPSSLSSISCKWTPLGPLRLVDKGLS